MRRTRIWFLVTSLTCLLAAAPTRAQTAGTTGGASQTFHLPSTAATTNATVIKNSVGNVYAVIAINITTSVFFLKFYDKATTPSCNGDPVKLTLPIPFGATNSGGGLVVPIPVGVQFFNGISFCVTANAADNDNTAAAAGVTLGVIYQ
jgi:hypothetical protein